MLGWVTRRHVIFGGSGGIRANEIDGKYYCATVRFRIFMIFLDFTVKFLVKSDYFVKNKTNHPISSNSHPSATAK